jgi:hypothetical protein
LGCLGAWLRQVFAHGGCDHPFERSSAALNAPRSSGRDPRLIIRTTYRLLLHLDPRVLGLGEGALRPVGEHVGHVRLSASGQVSGQGGERGVERND